MPLFHFDLVDDGVAIPGGEGRQLASLARAQVEAVWALADMSKDHRPIPFSRDLICTIRNADHEPVCRVAIAVRCELLPS